MSIHRVTEGRHVARERHTGSDIAPQRPRVVDTHLGVCDVCCHTEVGNPEVLIEVERERELMERGKKERGISRELMEGGKEGQRERKERREGERGRKEGGRVRELMEGGKRREGERGRKEGGRNREGTKE